MKRISIFLFAVFCMISLGYGQNKMTSELRSAARSAQADEKIPVVITLNEQFDAKGSGLKTNFPNKKERRAYLNEELQRFAKNSQQDLLKELQSAKNEVSDIHSFWIFNGISCQATPSQLEKIAQRTDVKEISWSKENTSSTIVMQEEEKGNRDALWNIAKIKADQVWNYNGTSGYTGDGVVVAVLDCGANYNHPDLIGQMWQTPSYPYGGWNFFGNGSANIMDDPNNGNGQGTMVAGIIAGTGSQGTATGIATGAKVMALKVSNKAAQVTEARILAAMEFASDTAHCADIVLVTAVENEVGPKESYRTAMTNLNELGIVAITAAGNRGQATAVPNSISAPSNCPSPWHNPDETINGGHTANICVGAVDNNDNKKLTSSIGPVSWNDYLYAASSTTQVGHTKPDVCAPGEGVTSVSYLGSGYKMGSGTPIAAAHVAATVALMLEANPDLTPAEIDQFLETSAVKCEGIATKNNYFGAGRIDALEAVKTMLTTVTAPFNLSATANHNQITLTWNGTASSYELFCNEESLGTVTGSSYTYTTNHSGSHIFYLKANSGNQQSGKSNFASIFVDPQGPQATIITDTIFTESNTVTFEWEAPAPKTVLRYGSAMSTTRSFGNYNGTQPSTTYWATRFNPNFLLDYAGCSIDTMSLYVTKAGTYNLYLYEGNPNGTLNPALQSWTLNVTAADIPGWVDVALNPAMSVNFNKDLWFVAKTTGSIADPATYSIISYEQNGFSSLASSDGKSWETQSNNWAWMIKAHLSNAAFTYNVQRDGATLANHLNVFTYTDTNVPSGVHEYTVTTNYGTPELESFPCEPLLAFVQTHFTVTFDAGTGTAPEPIQQETTGAPIILPEAEPSEICAAEGFTFAGWTIEPLNITETAPANMMLAGSEYIPYSDQTLYAVYANNQNDTEWSRAYSIANGDQVCLVCLDYNVELNNFNIQNQYATSQSITGGFSALHPFTLQESEGGFFLVDEEGMYLSSSGESNLIGVLFPGEQGLWNIEVINGYAMLRNTIVDSTGFEEHHQVTAFNIGNQTHFGCADYTETWNSDRKHVELYRLLISTDSYYAYDPGCGSNVTTPKIRPTGNASEIHLDPLSVTMSTATAGATIRYTTDGSEPTTISEQYLSWQPVSISATTTVKAKAFKSGYTPSGVDTQVYAFPTEFTKVSDFKTAANEELIAIINDNSMVVTQQYGKYTYVNGSTNRGLLIFDDYNFLQHNFTEGDVVTGIQGRYTEVNGQAMMTLMHDFSSTSNSGTVTPATATITNINKNNQYPNYDARLVIIKGVTFSQDMTWTNGMDPETVVTINQDGKTLKLKNRFNGLTCSVDTEHTYDVVGLIGKEGDLKFVYPRRNDDIRLYHHLTLQAGEHGTLQANSTEAGYLSTVVLTVTPENGFHLHDLYYYTTNPNQTTPIDQTSLSFVMPDEDVIVVAEFEEDVNYTVTFNPGTGTCSTLSLTETAWHSGITLPAATPLTSCAEDGYTFQGWATSFVQETMARPTMYLAGETFYPDGDMTLFAVYAIGGNDWIDIDNAADVIEGNYIISTKEGRFSYYLPINGPTMNPLIPRMTVNSEGEPVSQPGNQPLAPNHLWTFTKINATQYSITHEANGVTYYLKAYADANYGIQITTYEPSSGWVVTQDASRGLMLRFPNPEQDPSKATRYLSKTNESWANLTIYTYSGNIHLYLSPSNIYSTAPDCMEYVAAPEFLNVPEGIIVEDNYMVEMTCATEGAIIHYTTDGSTPTPQSAVYTEPFAVTETCTVNAIAILNDNQSAMSSQTYNFVRRFENIAEFKAAYSVNNSTELAKIIGDVQFVQRFGNNIYICDATAGLLLRDAGNVVPNNYNNGDIIQGGVVGTYARENIQPMMRVTMATAPGIPGTPVEPLEMSPSELTNDYDAQLVTITDAQFNANYTYNHNQVGFNVTNGINVYDNYSQVTLSGVQGDRYDITGFVGRYNYTTRLYPRSTEDFVRYYNIECDTTMANGSISTTPNHAKANTVVTLNSFPADGYEVGTWIVTDSDNNPVAVNGNTFTMPAKNVTVSAVFVLSEYTVTVNIEPEGCGIVTGAGTGFHYGDIVTLTATPNEGFEWNKWRLDSGTITTPYNNYSTTISFPVTNSVVLTATFTGLTYTITTAAEPEDYGTVNGAGTFGYGTLRHVVAHPNEGYQFDHWVINGTISENTNPNYSFTLTQNMDFVAHFVVAEFDITATAEPTEGGNVTGAGHYTYGDLVTLIATPNAGYQFLEWQVEGETYDTSDTLSFQVTQALDLVALFESLAPPTVEQTTTLENGWTWFSSYIEYDANSLNSIKEQIGAVNPSASLIKSQNKYVQYTNGQWFGNLTALDNASMYMISLDQILSITLSGPMTDPEAHPITLNAGWNWIGFLSQNPMGIADAFSGFTPNAGDVVKSQNGFATYSGTAWLGSLTSLAPGKGYMYQNNGTVTNTFTYPVGSKGTVNETATELHWKSNYSQFAHNLCMMVSLEGLNLSEGSHEIGAFVNGECRGSARIENVNGQAMAFLTVCGIEGEVVSFMVYDANANEEVASDVVERIPFANDAVYGNLTQPYLLHLRANGTNSLYDQVTVFPNPTTDKVWVIGTGIQEVRLYNAMGQIVLAKTFHEAEQAEINLGSLSAGVYMMTICSEGQMTNKTLVKQ